MYGVSYRYKGSTKYKTSIFAAKDDKDLQDQVESWLDRNRRNAFDKEEEIDKRTLKWGGDTIPLTVPNEPVDLPIDLNDYV